MNILTLTNALQTISVSRRQIASRLLKKMSVVGWGVGTAVVSNAILYPLSPALQSGMQYAFHLLNLAGVSTPAAASLRVLPMALLGGACAIVVHWAQIASLAASRLDGLSISFFSPDGVAHPLLTFSAKPLWQLDTALEKTLTSQRHLSRLSSRFARRSVQMAQLQRLKDANLVPESACLSRFQPAVGQVPFVCWCDFGPRSAQVLAEEVKNGWLESLVACIENPRFFDTFFQQQIKALVKPLEATVELLSVMENAKPTAVSMLFQQSEASYNATALWKLLPEFVVAEEKEIVCAFEKYRLPLEKLAAVLQQPILRKMLLAGLIVSSEQLDAALEKLSTTVSNREVTRRF